MGEVIFSQNNITDTVFSINSNNGDFGTGEADGDYTVFIEATQAITFTDIEWDCLFDEQDPFDPPIQVESVIHLATLQMQTLLLTLIGKCLI